MTDIVSKETRSRMMSAVPQTDSKPELLVRRMLHAMGYRYRLHRRDLPGTPDLVFSRLRKVIFVHGCFWHRHGCRKTTTPKSNHEYWESKFEDNRRRDRRVVAKLRREGWGVLVVWECQAQRPNWLARRLERFLEVG